MLVDFVFKLEWSHYMIYLKANYKSQGLVLFTGKINIEKVGFKNRFKFLDDALFISISNLFHKVLAVSLNV